LKTLKVRSIVEGNPSGRILFSSKPIAFLKGVDPDRGQVVEPKHPIFKKSFAGKILVFPNSVGSSVGAYVIYRMKKAGHAPKAIINQSADIITASGCAIAGIPLFDLPEGGMEELSSAKVVRFNRKKSEIMIS